MSVDTVAERGVLQWIGDMPAFLRVHTSGGPRGYQTDWFSRLQWDAPQNGGARVTDPERLPVTDEYGYTATNFRSFTFDLGSSWTRSNLPITVNLSLLASRDYPSISAFNTYRVTWHEPYENWRPETKRPWKKYNRQNRPLQQFVFHTEQPTSSATEGYAGGQATGIYQFDNFYATAITEANNAIATVLEAVPGNAAGVANSFFQTLNIANEGLGGEPRAIPSGFDYAWNIKKNRERFHRYISFDSPPTRMDERSKGFFHLDPFTVVGYERVWHVSDYYDASGYVGPRHRAIESFTGEIIPIGDFFRNTDTNRVGGGR